MADLDQFFHELEEDFARAQRLVIGALVAIIAGILLACYVTSAQAAPRVSSAEECATLADLAITARAMALEELERDKAERLVARIYIADSERPRELMRLVLEAAYASKASPLEFARSFYATCVGNGGNVDGILGAPA